MSVQAPAPTKERGELWLGVAEALHTDIQRRALPPGTKLPTETQLASQHGVSRFTVRRALAELQRRKVVRIEQGRGLFVAEQVIGLAIGRRTRLSENFRRLNLEGSRRYISAHVEAADAETSAGLGIAPEADVITVLMLSCVGDRPIGLAQNRFPYPRFKGIDDEIARTGSITAALERFDIADYVRTASRIASRLPSATEAALLKIRRTQPLITSVKIDSDIDGRPICHGESCYPGDRVALILE